ncbi:MAG: hypothetical protein WBO73_03685 [Gammaproteobacteria bacterium]
MFLRLPLLIALCLVSFAVPAETGSALPIYLTEIVEQPTPEQQQARKQVVSEEEDPQAQSTTEHQQESDALELRQQETVEASEVDQDQANAQKEVKSEEEEPSFKREEKVPEVVVKEPLKGNLYGSIRLRYRSTDAGSILGDAGSRAGLEAEWHTGPDAWVYARLEAGFNVLDELDTLLSAGGGGGESEQGDSVFPRLYTVGIETPVLVASYGKTWSTYYRIANFTDRFDSAGSDAVGTFNANTDGGATGTGRADSVLQTRAYVDFLPEAWKVKPFNLNIQLQGDQPIPRVDGVNYLNAIGLSAVLESRSDYTLGIAYNLAFIEDLNDPAVQAAGISGDAQALLIGARWFDEQWYLGLTVARLSNHETTDQGTYFIGWGSELYARYRLIKRYWLVAGYNWLRPDADQTQAGEYELLYGIFGLRYSIDDFNRLAYAEWRVDSTISETGEELGNILTIGLRWDF